MDCIVHGLQRICPDELVVTEQLSLSVVLSAEEKNAAEEENRECWETQLEFSLEAFFHSKPWRCER